MRTQSRHASLAATAALGAMSLGAAATASAAEPGLIATETQALPVKVELIGNSRLGCGQGMPLWSASSGGVQCAFDIATRGARFSAVQDFGAGSIETYATIAHATAGAFTPDQLLVDPRYRSNEATDFMLVGLKGAAFNDRLSLVAEFARTDRVVDELIDRDWALDDHWAKHGSSARIAFDAKLADKPGLKWSLNGEYRAVSENYWIGRSSDLSAYYAFPGNGLTLSSKAQIGEFGMLAGIEQNSSSFGRYTTVKGGLDWNGVALRMVSRKTGADGVEGTTLLGSSTRTDSAYLDLDLGMLAMRLLPEAGDLPFVVPTTISLSYRKGEMDTDYSTGAKSYNRSSLGVDATWETPIGETSLGYWRDSRTGLTAGAFGWLSESFDAYHYVRRGNWRFGLDASLMRNRDEGSGGISDSTLSFGQSIAYSTPNGPEFRLQMGQDRGATKTNDLTYSASNRYSSITASLDLSRYLQKRFERPDLHLTLDYRKVLDRTNNELSLYDELVERWIDGNRREGLLMSFGMRL